ncbi:MAG: hypothetical protein AAF806_20305 [Bacteroidota bacterium]
MSNIIDDMMKKLINEGGINETGLLFQTGYLTIKKTEKVGFERRYILGYPNAEVRKSMTFMLYHLINAQEINSHS